MVGREPRDAIFEKHGVGGHDFDPEPFFVTAGRIESACRHFKKTAKKEVRILCKQDTREPRPIWNFGFEDRDDRDGIRLLKSARYGIRGFAAG